MNDYITVENNLCGNADGSDDVQNRFTAYVQTALRNRRNRYLKNKGERLKRETFDLPDDLTSPDEYLNLVERESLLYALRKIQEREQQIVYLRAVEEHSFADIADALDMKISSVSMVYYRALHKLKLLLQEDEK